MKVKQHAWVVMQPDGRLTRFLVFAKVDDPESVPCLLCGDVCLTVVKDELGHVGWEVHKPIHPTADDQQHCADCCTGCRINRRKDIVL